jgi:hypothetical protein
VSKSAGGGGEGEEGGGGGEGRKGGGGREGGGGERARHGLRRAQAQPEAGGRARASTCKWRGIGPGLPRLGVVPFLSLGGIALRWCV